MALNYTNYLKLAELLELQIPQSDPAEHDEYLFIIIHQTYELWFKELLLEFGKVEKDFTAGDLFGAIHTFKRARTVLKTLVGQVDVLETMTPMSFTSFRARLDEASGFQSVQYRELEFMLGYKRPDMLQYYAEGSPERATLEQRLKERTVVDHFYDFLETLDVAIPAELREEPAEEATQPNAEIQQALLKIYKERPEVSILLELMTDFDEGFQEWRYRHVKLVERSIGKKHGTGGSLGVPFLKRSLFKSFFPDLWEIRHEL